MTKDLHISGESALAVSARTFVSAGWVFPAYFRMAQLTELAASLATLPEEDRSPRLGEVLVRMYTGDHLARMVVHRYGRVPHLCAFSERIAEGVEASQLNLHRAAVGALIPVVEGVLRALANEGDGDFKKGGSDKIRREVAELIDEQDNVERITLLEAFGVYLQRHLFESTRQFAGKDGLNRHGILHGNFGDDRLDVPAAFAKVMGLIDLLCFFMTLRTTGVSALGPTHDRRSQALAEYYARLGKLSMERPGERPREP